MVAVSAKVKGLLIDEGLITEQSWGTVRRGRRSDRDAPRRGGAAGARAHGPRAAGIPPVDLRRVELDVATIETVDPELCRSEASSPSPGTATCSRSRSRTRSTSSCSTTSSVERAAMCVRSSPSAPSRRWRPCVRCDGGQSKVEEMIDSVSAAADLHAAPEEDEPQDIEFRAAVMGTTPRRSSWSTSSSSRP